ncbi:hypothetical protein AURDEDRAFT_183855 [Auricularia subglabra TFB-10046 SS5]|nr:hypothetical protein AURDEDRAFT_183855 [Auricularia subglabra TFB-10046 SS5]
MRMTVDASASRTTTTTGGRERKVLPSDDDNRWERGQGPPIRRQRRSGESGRSSPPQAADSPRSFMRGHCFPEPLSDAPTTRRGADLFTPTHTTLKLAVRRASCPTRG